jgi:tripartite-type tricarboxylate transporter receptor subunit TctC
MVSRIPFVPGRRSEKAMVTRRWVLRRSAGAIVGAVVGLALVSNSASAADYFAGKTIRIIVGFGPASAYALYGQLAASHLGRFIPGKPNVLVSYMPGAAGLTAVNYLYEMAPRDGTVISVPMQALASQQMLARNGVRYDATKFNYIGRATANVPVHMVWHTTPVRSFDDVKSHEIVTGADGIAGTHVDLPRAQNALLGTRWKIITGYGDDTRIAMTRGETQAGVMAATLFNNQFKSWLDEGKVRVIVQYADFRHPTFPDLPTIIERAERDDAKAVFKFLVSLATVGRAYAAPPGVPAGTVQVLRDAFQAMINDPAFRADAEKRGADLLPMSGQELAAYVGDIVRTPAHIVRMTNEVIASR